MPDKTRTAFLDIARALAAVLVVYTHIYDVYIREHKGVTTPPTDALDDALVVPLKLDEQGIGAISVPIFFIISGFVVTPIALRMGPGRFGINRAFRIFPLLLFVIAVAATLIAFGQKLLSTHPQPVNVGTFLSNVSLWNFIDRPFGSWVAVAWTLAVEVLFYGMLVAVLPLLRKRVWLAIAVQLEVVLILLITYRAFGDEYRALVINMVYTLIPIMGQAVWAAWARKIPAWLAGVYVTVAWLMFVWSGHLAVDPNYIPRAFPIAIAMMLFLIGLFAEPYLRQRRFWTELSERTYSIYLLHGVVAFPLMHWLFNELPLWLTVLVAVVATGLAAELSYRFVERPSHDLARRLSRRPKPTDPEPEDDEDYEDEYDDEYLDDYEDDFDAFEDVEDSEDFEDFEDEPTEKTPPVPLPPQRRRPAPWSRPAPAQTDQTELSTEKIEPVARPRRRPAVQPRTGGPNDNVSPRTGVSANGTAPRTSRATEASRAGTSGPGDTALPRTGSSSDASPARARNANGAAPPRTSRSNADAPARTGRRTDAAPPRTGHTNDTAPPRTEGAPDRIGNVNGATPARTSRSADAAPARTAAPHRTSRTNDTTPPRTGAAPTRTGASADPAPHRTGTPPTGTPPHTGDRRRDVAPRRTNGSGPTDPTDRPAEDHPAHLGRLNRPNPPTRRRALDEPPNGTPLWPEADPSPGGRRRAEDREPPAVNGSSHPGTDLPPGAGRRRRAADILNGVPESNGGRRRAEPPRASAHVTWPDERDDPDGAQPTGGRHRSD